MIPCRALPKSLYLQQSMSRACLPCQLVMFIEIYWNKWLGRVLKNEKGVFYWRENIMIIAFSVYHSKSTKHWDRQIRALPVRDVHRNAAHNVAKRVILSWRDSIDLCQYRHVRCHRWWRARNEAVDCRSASKYMYCRNPYLIWHRCSYYD